VSSSITLWPGYSINGGGTDRHIASVHAERFDQFYRQHFNPYLNFHRPCGVPEVSVTPKGKRKGVYRWHATPGEILRQLPGLAGFLRLELTHDQLQTAAAAQPDRLLRKCKKSNAQTICWSVPKAER